MTYEQGQTIQIKCTCGCHYREHPKDRVPQDGSGCLECKKEHEINFNQCDVCN